MKVNNMESGFQAQYYHYQNSKIQPMAHTFRRNNVSSIFYDM